LRRFFLSGAQAASQRQIVNRRHLFSLRLLKPQETTLALRQYPPP
jgi:hypothetical protein